MNRLEVEARLLRKILTEDYCEFAWFPIDTPDETTLVVDNQIALTPEEAEVVKKIWEKDA